MIQKPHRFAALDFIRGIAAIVVMVFHVQLETSRHFFTHGYLAVDLFFILSGFVVSAAYEGRLAGSMSFMRFMVSVRLLRLYPLFFLSTLVSAVALYITGAGLVRPSFVVRELLLVPVFQKSFWLYPLNPAQWSIFFELLANAVHAVFFSRLKLPGLAVVVAVSAIGLVLCQHHYHSMDMGARMETFAGGLARVFFSYTAGIVLWRLHSANSLPQVTRGWIAAPVTLIGCLCIPASTTSAFGQGVDLIAVTLVFPAIVTISLGAIRSPRINKTCAIAGNLSYPVYLMQLPVFWGCRMAFQNHGTNVVTVVSVLLTIIVSWVVFYLYDKPVRAWVGAKLRVRAQTIGSSAP